MRRRFTASRIRLLPEIAATFCKYNLLQPLFKRPFALQSMHFIATHRCNARCVMCGIWKEKARSEADLSASEVATILCDRLFSRVRYVGISGGEPFLRDDLPELVEVFHHGCPDIKRLSISTNGILTGRIEAALPELVASSRRNGALLDFSVSVHAVGDPLDRIYGVPGAFDKIAQTLDLLRRRRENGELTVSLNCVLLKDNLDDARRLRAWGRNNGLSVNFVLGEERDRFANHGLRDALPDAGGRENLVSFLEEMYGDISLNNLSPVRYLELIGLIEKTRRRSTSCYYAIAGVLLGHDGKLYYCSHSREIGDCRAKPPYEIYHDRTNLEYREKGLLQEECFRCPPYTMTRLELEKNMHEVLRLVLRRRLTRKK